MIYVMAENKNAISSAVSIVKKTKICLAGAQGLQFAGYGNCPQQPL